MFKRPTPDEQRLQEIVAYLDGELSPEDSARVERQLASDEAYRQELQSVERAWQALDELPMAIVDDRFSQTTMELAVQAAKTEIAQKTAAMPVVRRRNLVSRVLAAATAAALGFLVVRMAWQNPNRQLLADLPVIDNVDVYSQFDRPEFLRSLRLELGDQLDQMGGAPVDLSARLQRFRTVTDVEQRDAWLDELDNEERTSLRAKSNRFAELPEGEQQRLRELHEAVVTAADAPELQRAMLVYHAWLGGLPPGRQFELRNMPADQRIETIKDWSDRMRDDALFTLTGEELRRLIGQLREPLQEVRRDAAKDFLRSDQRPGDGRGRGRGGRGQGLNWLSNAVVMKLMEEVSRDGEFQRAVIAALPERTRDPYQQLPPREKGQRLMTWLRQSEATRGEVSQEELERFFAEELDAETRAELLSLPPGEMQQALRWRYRRQPGRGFAGPRGRGGEEQQDDRRGPGGPGPGWDGRPGRGPGGPHGPGGFGPREGFGGPHGPHGRSADGPFGDERASGPPPPSPREDEPAGPPPGERPPDGPR